MSVITGVPRNEEILREQPKSAFAYPWYTWLNQVYVICFSLQQSGTTAERPDKLIWIGRRYFDVTLGIPVWVKSAKPTVWVNASGAVV